ncbi:MAG: hypothetical protein ACRDOU_08740, partial [Streptosporangiaceae bacterium]
MRKSRGPHRLRERIAARLRGRTSLRVVIACGLLAVLTLPVGPARWRLDSNPNPPSTGQISSAENRVKQQKAALGAQQGRLSSAAAALAQLDTQAEVLTERYDEVQVNEQRAAAA